MKRTADVQIFSFLDSKHERRMASKNFETRKQSRNIQFSAEIAETNFKRNIFKACVPVGEREEAILCFEKKVLQIPCRVSPNFNGIQ